LLLDSIRLVRLHHQSSVVGANVAKLECKARFLVLLEVNLLLVLRLSALLDHKLFLVRGYQTNKLFFGVLFKLLRLQPNVRKVKFSLDSASIGKQY